MWHVQRDYGLNLECLTAEKRRWCTSLKSHSLSDAPCPFRFYFVGSRLGGSLRNCVIGYTRSARPFTSSSTALAIAHERGAW